MLTDWTRQKADVDPRFASSDQNLHGVYKTQNGLWLYTDPFFTLVFRGYKDTYSNFKYFW